MLEGAGEREGEAVPAVGEPVGQLEAAGRVVALQPGPRELGRDLGADLLAARAS